MKLELPTLKSIAIIIITGTAVFLISQAGYILAMYEKSTTFMILFMGLQIATLITVSVGIFMMITALIYNAISDRLNSKNIPQIRD